mgnify:FL=1
MIITVIFAASETADHLVGKHSADYEKVLNEQTAATQEEASKISDHIAKDRWSRLTDNIRAQLVSLSIRLD